MTRKDEETKLAQKQKNLSDDYRSVFKTAAGKRVLYDLMCKNFVLQPTMNNTHGSREHMDRNEGKREAVLGIMAMVEYSPEKLLELIKNSEEDEGDHV